MGYTPEIQHSCQNMRVWKMHFLAHMEMLGIRQLKLQGCFFSQLIYIGSHQNSIINHLPSFLTRYLEDFGRQGIRWDIFWICPLPPRMPVITRMRLHFLAWEFRPKPSFAILLLSGDRSWRSTDLITLHFSTFYVQEKTKVKI